MTNDAKGAPISEIVDVKIESIGAVPFDSTDFLHGWGCGFYGQPVPEGASDFFVQAHSMGAKRAEEDAEWRKGERVREARVEGARLLILELLCDDGTVAGSRQSAEEYASRLLEPGFYEDQEQLFERLGMK
jgi:hypothetical protein